MVDILSPKITSIVLAAGLGARASSLLPKQYQIVAGLPLLRWTLMSLQKSPEITDITVVIHPNHQKLYEQATAGLTLSPPVFGGQERQDSVRYALESLETTGAPDFVLIHDAARPLITSQVIQRVVEALKFGNKGAVPCIPVEDTLKFCDGASKTPRTIERHNLYRAQTPQGFNFKILLDAHKKHGHNVHTDDSALMEKEGIPYAIVQGDKDNFKVTTQEDILMMANILHPPTQIRTGIGYDVHKLVPGDYVTLGGVNIPYHQSLQGHSDSDVLLHAITDAVLGSIAAGDIGTHFPPSMLQWKNANSHIFLNKALLMVREKGGHINNIDVVIICEAPKISPHRQAIQESLAKMMELPLDAISIKATTTEQLGSIGRGEGIAAQAIITLTLPYDYKST